MCINIFYSNKEIKKLTSSTKVLQETQLRQHHLIVMYQQHGNIIFDFHYLTFLSRQFFLADLDIVHKKYHGCHESM